MKYQILEASVVLLAASNFAAGQIANPNEARDRLSDTEAYIQEKRTAFAVQKQTIDIFGRPQDPKISEQIQQVSRQSTQVAKKQTIPYQELVNGIRVSVMDSVNDLMVVQGSGTVRPKQIIELNYAGKPVQLRFEGVRTNGRATGAYFRDLASGELYLRTNDRLPSGIQRGGQRSTSPGGIKRINQGSASEPIKINLANDSPR